nr:unnamed protein product [Fasciola hepatica]
MTVSALSAFLTVGSVLEAPRETLPCKLDLFGSIGIVEVYGLTDWVSPVVPASGKFGSGLPVNRPNAPERGSQEEKYRIPGDATHTKGPVPEASWATALALVYFETALDTRASEWKLLARKANGWSMKQVTVGISDANSAKEYCDALTAEAKNFW